MKKVPIVLLICIGISCNTSNSIPPDIIKPAEMQSILWDMIRGDILAVEIIKKDSSQNIKSAGLALTKKILAIHNIDNAKFDKSIAFYEKHPTLMRTVFDSLSAIQTRKSYSETERKVRPVKDYHSPERKIIP